MNIENDSLDFTIIIPAYNAEKTLRKCLQSILNQNYPRHLYEVVVVNDNSTDSTPFIAGEFNIQCISGDYDSISAVRNCPVTEAKGRILGFIDSDMEIDRNLLATAKKKFDDEKFNGGLSFSDHAPDDASWIGKIWNNPYRISSNRTHNPGILFSRMLFVLKEVHVKVGMFDEEFFKGGKAGEDKEYSFRLKSAGYPLLIISTLDNIHLGYEKSFGEFIRNEYWRQGNMLPIAAEYNYRLRMLRHPLFCGLHLIMLIVLVISFIFKNFYITSALATIWAMPSLLFAIKRMDLRMFWHGLPSLWFVQLIRWNIAGFALIPQINWLIVSNFRKKRY